MTIRIYDSNINFGSFALNMVSSGLYLTANAKFLVAGVESASPLYGTSYGFASRGAIFTPPFTNSNVIDRFPFATNANATDYGDLTVARIQTSGQSSTTHGYTSGGNLTPTPPLS